MTTLSEGMINYLEKRNLINASCSTARKRGKKRLYSFSDILMLRIIKRFLDVGISVGKLQQAFKLLRAYFPDKHTLIPARYLVTDGNSIYLRDDTADNPADRTEGGQLTFGFFVDIEDARDRLLSQVLDARGGPAGPRQLVLSL